MVSNKFYREKTDKTPELIGDINEGTLSIRGKSLPENAQLVFSDFRDWLVEFYKSQTMALDVQFDLEYYNTSSSSIILDILKNLKDLQSSKDIKVTWLYEEDDLEMKEIGEDFQDIIGEVVVLKTKSTSV